MTPLSRWLLDTKDEPIALWMQVICLLACCRDHADTSRRLMVHGPACRSGSWGRPPLMRSEALNIMTSDATGDVGAP